MSTPRRLSVLLTAWIALAATAPARAGLGVWTPLGPDGGVVTVVAASPNDREVVFAGTYQSGIFRSGDGGRSWQAVNGGVGAEGIFGPFSCFAFDPRRPEVVYAGTFFSGSYRSADGGRTWSRNADIPSSNPNTRLFSLVADPRSAGTVYAGTTVGVFRSNDGGRSWKTRNQGLPRGAAYVVAFDSAGRDLYAGVDAGVFRSGDRGERWRPAKTGLVGSVFALSFDPRSPATVLAASSNGLYRSLDGGRRWSQVGTGVIQSRLTGAGFQEASGRVFAASDHAVYASADRGATWTPVAGRLANPPVLSFAVGLDALFSAPGRFTGGPALTRSDSGGASWRRSDHGLSALGPRQLAFHPTAPATLFLGTGPGGLFRSNDGGATWSRVVLDSEQPFLGIDGVAFEPSSPSTVYASSPARLPYLLRSDDGGTIWSGLATGIASRLEVIEPDPRAPGALWTGGLGEAYHLTNSGHSLEPLALTSDSFPWIRDIDVDPIDPRIVTFSGGKLVGGQVPTTVPKVFRTEDGGTTWQERAGLPPEAVTVLQLSADPASPEILYAATYAGLYRFDGTGGGWTRKLDFKDRGGAVVATSEALYAARSGAGILRSTDRGETWTPIRKGLGSLRVTRLWADPANPRHLYAGTATGGLYDYTEPENP